MHPEIDCADRNAHRADEKGYKSNIWLQLQVISVGTKLVDNLVKRQKKDYGQQDDSHAIGRLLADQWQ